MVADSTTVAPRCPYCNTENRADARACGFCGRALGTPPAKPTPPTPTPPAPATQTTRREPTLESAAPVAVESPTPPLTAWRREQPQRPRGGGSRALALCAMFLLGAACGAGGLWLHGHPQGWKQALAYWPQRIQHGTARIRPTQPEAESTTPAGELPYDGHTPATAPVTPPATSTAATAAMAAAINPPPRPALPAAPVTAVTEPPVVTNPPQTAAAPQPRRRHPATSALARNDAPADTARERSLTPLMLAQCESMSGADQRAQCKREVCHGKRGQYGCPAAGTEVLQ